MNTTTFARDLSRTTLAPPVQRAEFGAAPDFSFLVRVVALARDADGTWVVRVSDRMAGDDTGDHTEERHSLELDARRAYRRMTAALGQSRAWKLRGRP